MMEEKLLFEEKQYLGFNKYSVISRLAMSAICFLFFYISVQRGQSGEIFLILGISILVISFFLLFVMHLHTKVYADSIIMEGFWTTRKVKVMRDSIASVEKSGYNKFFFNNPVYNLHIKGTIRFYTRGNEAVRVTDRDGLVYVIGTQRPEELSAVLNVRIH